MKKKCIPIADFHNDLLSYLAQGAKFSLDDIVTGSSPMHMEKGAVCFCLLAIFSPTVKASQKAFIQQQEIFATIRKHPFFDPMSGHTHIGLSVENFSSCIGEEEEIEKAFVRIQKVLKGEKLVSASLTWNEENRFGGGSHTAVGLKEDGKKVLDFLSKYCSAIDVSHASDRLCEEIFSYLDATKNPLHCIASHSNFRAVKNVCRNLPDEIAKEIVRRGGIIGLNCIKKFLGNTYASFFKHIEHGLQIGLEEGLALGADFFFPSSMEIASYETYSKEQYFPKMKTMAQLQSVFDGVEQHFGKNIRQKISYKNGYDRLLQKALMANFISDPLCKKFDLAAQEENIHA